MNRLALIVLALIGVLSGCATVSQSPQQDILGVWELAKARNLQPQDAGFVQNIKLVFQPEGRLYKMGPDEDKCVEQKLYGYRIEGHTLVRTRPDHEDVRTPFSIRGSTLVITEPDGAVVYFRKRSSDFTRIPVWEPRLVPFSVNYDRSRPPAGR